jgi:signal peptidase I
MMGTMNKKANRRPDKRGEQRPDTRGGKRAGKRRAPASSSVMELIRTLVVGFLLFIVLRTFLVQTFTITSGSMENTLLVGDFLVLSKLAYGARLPGTALRTPGYSKPRHGDIIVFHGRHEPLDLVKRIVGMPGDTLAMQEGLLIRNSNPVDEPYAAPVDRATDGWHPDFAWQDRYRIGVASDDQGASRDEWGPIVVPDASFFVLGDNRDDSLDSRYYGFVQERDVLGRAVRLYFSYDRAAHSAVPVLGQVRWERLGERLR